MRITLVACCKRKLVHPAPARDLYTSTWFRLARRYAEQEAAHWFILSARHGLVRPDTVLEPYECALPTLSPAERRDWASRVLGALQSHLTEQTHLTLLAGRVYRQHLVPAMEAAGYPVRVPLAGLGIGRQVRWLQAAEDTRWPANFDPAAAGSQMEEEG